MVSIKERAIPKLMEPKAGKISTELILPTYTAMGSLFVFAEAEGFAVQPNPYGLGQGHQSLELGISLRDQSKRTGFEGLYG
jgi:hypothetical protein